MIRAKTVLGNLSEPHPEACATCLTRTYCPTEYPDELDEEAEFDDSDNNAAETSTSASGSVGGAAPHVRPGIVHRLDKGTSGLLVVAKDERSLKGLSKQFKVRRRIPAVPSAAVKRRDRTEAS